MEEELIKALQAAPLHFLRDRDGRPSYQVLGWGAWAALRQRQLCSLLGTTWHWVDSALALPEQAETFRNQAGSKFSHLQLFPLVKFFNPASDGSEKAAYRSALQEMTRQYPERVSFAIAKESEGFAREWYAPVLPYGTTYDLGYRNAWKPLGGCSRLELEQSKAAAPHSYLVLEAYLSTVYPSGPTVTQLQKELGPISYNCDALWRLANAVTNDPAAYQSTFEKICELEPDYYTVLGKYLVAHDLPEAAARAYQKAVDYATDRVRVSNSCRWLVDYYYDHGRRAEALAVAEMAAQVFSSDGLETAAHLMERDGQLEKAESYLQDEAERYHQAGSLAAFYQRHRGASPRFASEYEKRVAQVFPGGAASFARLQAAPGSGILLRSASPKTASLGLKPGDVIVAINGTRVTNKSQYFLLLDTAASSRISFTAWNGRDYITGAIELPDRRLGVDISQLSR